MRPVTTLKQSSPTRMPAIRATERRADEPQHRLGVPRRDRSVAPADRSGRDPASSADDPPTDAGLLCGLLRAGAANAGVLRLTQEAADHPEVGAVLRFLVAQGWLERGGDAANWRVTPIGRLWIEDISHSPSVKFHRHAGKLFLVHWANRETVVWYDGRFATISVPFGFGENYEVRLETELVATATATHMPDALAAACRLLTGEPPVPPPTEPERLETRMHRFLDRL